jgi:serine/threonine protein kinase
MSISQSHPSDTQQHCIHCGTVLPPIAAFCGKCGKRVEKSDQPTKYGASIDKHVDIERYRITSLIQRIPYIQLYLAMDTQQQRPVAIRDIDIQQIDISSRSHILKALEQEYDLLRREKSNDVLPLIASFHAQNHLYSISAWSLTTGTSPVATSRKGQAPRIYTLQDLLQSGIGLPDEQIALDWILRLAHAVEHLHRINIVIGTLDPSTVLVSQKDYSGRPMLFSSWMLPAVQTQLQQTLNIANALQISHGGQGRAAAPTNSQISHGGPGRAVAAPTDRTTFFSPEAKQGRWEMRSDIYSIGAILYLLVTGMAPVERSITTSQPLRSPRAINPRVSETLAKTILKALESDPSARFQSVSELATVLLQQQGQSKVPHHHTLLGHSRSVEKVGTQLAEINFTSDKYNNKTEQIKAARTNFKANDDTISIVPILKQLARDYLSRINIPRLGQEQLKSDHEEPIVENGYSEETIRLARKEIQDANRKHTATVVEAVSGSEAGTDTEQNPHDATVASLEILEHISLEEVPNTQTPATDAEQKPHDATVASLEILEHISLEEVPNTQTPATGAEQKPHDTTVASLESHEHISLEEVPNTQTPATGAEQKPHAATATPLESHEPSLIIEQAEQDDSSNEVPTDIENTASANSNSSAIGLSPLSSEVSQQGKRESAAPTKTFSGLLERVKRFLLGGQPCTNNAVAMIETPMRIQPNKNYTIRIHIMGRNEPKHVSGSKQSHDAAKLGGLGSLIHGELVHIEVRSALYHNYAYIVQQTDVEVPAHNYAAEVTIPMRSITDSSGTKRERLHIFFTDEKHNPLYEKPFLIELFISNLVQSGHEGHNVLSIPL